MNKLIFISVIALVHIYSAIALAKPLLSQDNATTTKARLEMKSRWLTHTDGSLVKDPQTSGLIFRNGFLLSIGDGSAAKDKQLKLLPIDRTNQQLQEKLIPIVQSDAVKQSCFVDYLDHGPDLEALAQDPADPNVVIIATEDFYELRLSEDCFKRYGQTGSTAYPSLLLRVAIGEHQAVITHVKAVQFPTEYRLGNYPNDGVEGLTFGSGRKLYIGVEKDLNNRPRIFETTISHDFWDSPAMAVVKDSELVLPPFKDNKNHPINGLTYIPTSDSDGFVIAAARNDNQLWILDTTKQKAPLVIELDFLAEARSEACPHWQKMDNYSIEGIVVVENTLWLINDPWKAAYKKNAICPEMLETYVQMTPLLSRLNIEQAWLQR